VLRRIDMPTVGSKEYSYDKEGMAAAEAEAARTGMPVVSKPVNAGPEKLFKEGGVVYANARGGRSATQGTKYRS
jgi:glycosyltransferase involved in cell wall biosynthesis